MSDPHSVISQFGRLWAAGDLDAVMRLVGQNCVFTLHVSDDVVEHAGRWEGREQIRLALTMVRQHYEYTLYRPVIMGVDGGTVRVRVEFMGTHRASGEQIGMTFRQVFVVEHGQIVRCDEFHDRAKLEAYLRLIRSGASNT